MCISHAPPSPPASTSQQWPAAAPEAVAHPSGVGAARGLEEGPSRGQEHVITQFR